MKGRSTPAHLEPTSRIAVTAWVLIGVLLVLLLSFAWQGPDIFYHLYLGKRILATHSAEPTDNLIVQQPSFVNIYWLFQLICYGLYSLAGVYGVSGLFMIVWIGMFAYWLRTTGAARLPVLGLPFALGAVLVFQNRFEPRPEVFSYFFLSMQIYWLSTWPMTRKLSWRELTLFAGTEILWANIHGYFVLGPMMVGARLVSALLTRKDRVEVIEIGRLLAVTLLATIVSPLGPRTWQGVYFLWVFLGEMRAEIREFAPPTGIFLRVWTIKLFWIYWAATGIVTGWTLYRRRADLFHLVLVLVALYLSATTARGIPFLLLFSAPMWGRFFAGLTPVLRADRRPAPQRTTGSVLSRLSTVLTAVATLCLSGWVVTGGFYHSLLAETEFGPRLPPHAYAIHFREYLAENPLRGKIFNNAADGGFLEYSFPDLRIYMDSRYTDAGPVKEYFSALVNPEAFERLHARHDFDAALLKVTDSGPLLAATMASPDWALAYADLHRAFMVNLRGSHASAPRSPPRLYQGEDLSQRVNGLPAIQWVALLIKTRNRALLLDALGQFARAPRIPSFVILYALQYGIETGDGQIIAAAREMAPRMLALDAASGEAVDRLLRAAGGPTRAGSSGPAVTK